MGPHRQAAQALQLKRRVIAEEVTERHFEAHPEFDARYGTAGREKCRDDAEYHLAYLEEAVAASSPELFADYVAWAASMLASRGVPEADLVDHLRTVLAVLGEMLPADQGAAIHALASPALERLSAQVPESATPAGSPAHAFLAALRSGGAPAAHRVVEDLTGAGLPLRDVYVDAIQPSLHEIGRLWQVNQLTVADEHYLSAAIQMVLAQLYSQLFAKAPTRAPVVIACVSSELHEIGARMVADLLQLEGYDSHYLGANTPVRDLVAFVGAKRVPVLGLSTSRAANLSHVENAVRAVRADPATRDVKIVVGGSPFVRVPDLWRTVGADAHASDARQAIAVVDSLVA